MMESAQERFESLLARPKPRKLEADQAGINPVAVTAAVARDLPRDHRRIPAQPERDLRADKFAPIQTMETGNADLWKHGDS